MIPRHRPPFGIGTLLRAVLPGSRPCSREQLEQEYAQSLGVPHAIWLPSARYGICHGLRIGSEPGDRVFCPAFTCGVVHQAVRLSGRPMTCVDCGTDDMLMDLPFLQQHLTPGSEIHLSGSAVAAARKCAVVLSEVFGHRYEKPEVLRVLDGASLRIFDMAMCIPTASDFERLIGRDVAVVSFGLGKSLYSGWGGMAFTRNDDMAAGLREQLRKDLHGNTRLTEFRRNTLIWLRTLAHSSLLYKFSRRAAERRATDPSIHSQQSAAASLESPERLSRDWWQEPTALHLKLAHKNFRRSAALAAERIESCRVYRTELERLLDQSQAVHGGRFRLPADNSHAMSHFCLRVDRNLRDQLRQHLWQAGIDTSILFPFPEGASRDQLPNAAGLTEEILGLPLSNGPGKQNILRICDLIADFLVRHKSSSEGATAFRRVA